MYQISAASDVKYTRTSVDVLREIFCDFNICTRQLQDHSLPDGISDYLYLKQGTFIVTYLRFQRLIIPFLTTQTPSKNPRCYQQYL